MYDPFVPRYLFIIVMLFPAPLAAAPVPTHLMPDTPPYFPTSVGTTWVYSYSGNPFTETISALEHRNGETFIMLDYVNGETRSPSALLRLNKDGLARLSSRGSEYVEPYWLIKRPAKPRDKWDFAIRFKPDGRAGDSGSKQIGEPDEVEFNGRKLKTIRVITKISGTTLTTWYAPGIGMVKETGRGELILKSFKSGAE